MDLIGWMSFDDPADDVMGEQSTNADVWRALQPAVDRLLSGETRHLNVMALGTSGSGKSHTMNGGYRDSKRTMRDEGVASRLFKHLFSAKDREDAWTITVVRYEGISSITAVRETTTVTGISALLAIYEAACSSRRTEATERNATSSRALLHVEVASVPSLFLSAGAR